MKKTALITGFTGQVGSQMADFLLENTDYSIKELAHLLKTVIQYKGEFRYNLNKPDGTYEKLTCCDKIKQMNWQAYTKLEDGLRSTFHWYKNSKGLI
ncbi:hypothetical protein [Campylobacter coli]|uniref:hypothetical protein n=1 Tax=Campylobacter coli TaxID=195 RepID=UPI0032E4C05F